ncbi:hypothetical protein DUNSADRAFT_5818 [Dunaliella salina]|uniref:Encoded protein n=1 Tax=Dunaliella salina TaxID=3046 RepID=A0ABQ7GPK3_DUNSA|nr:hypothetical protein DUNSADRAFT_5818 [Dunaliella salina]|eukprot:KAF5836530.1 hypothetical protein DUNSADRAFT_5818 [Dunaliella salina]
MLAALPRNMRGVQTSIKAAGAGGHAAKGTAAALLNLNQGCGAVAKRAAHDLIEAARFQIICNGQQRHTKKPTSNADGGALPDAAPHAEADADQPDAAQVGHPPVH